MIMRRFFASVVATLVLAAALIGAPARAQFVDQQSYKVTTGSANAYAIQLPNVSSMQQIVGVLIKFTPNFSNTGAATISVNGLTPVAILKPTQSSPAALSGGEIVASPTAQPTCGMWNGSIFILLCNLNASPAATIPPPQGYLTPCQVSSGTPVAGCAVGQIIQTGDVASATSLYYEPFVGGQLPIWNGTSFQVQNFSELALAIPSSRLANTIYDVCITTTTAGAYSATGTPTAVFSVAWTTSTAGAGNRGSGAGTAQIAQVNGIWVNAVAISAVNGANTYSVPANACTIVATVLIDGTAGQITNTTTWGSARKWSVSNFYNQQPIVLVEGDSTANWTYSTSTVRQSNGSANNKITIVLGLPTQKPAMEMNQFVQAISDGSSDTGAGQFGIGFNSTTAFSGTNAQVGITANTAITLRNLSNSIAQYEAPPFIGAAVVNALEAGNNNGSSSSTFFGTQANMRLKVSFGG